MDDKEQIVDPDRQAAMKAFDELPKEIKEHLIALAAEQKDAKVVSAEDDKSKEVSGRTDVNVDKPVSLPSPLPTEPVAPAPARSANLDGTITLAAGIVNPTTTSRATESSDDSAGDVESVKTGDFILLNNQTILKIGDQEIGLDGYMIQIGEVSSIEDGGKVFIIASLVESLDKEADSVKKEFIAKNAAALALLKGEGLTADDMKKILANERIVIEPKVLASDVDIEAVRPLDRIAEQPDSPNLIDFKSLDELFTLIGSDRIDEQTNRNLETFTNVWDLILNPNSTRLEYRLQFIEGKSRKEKTDYFKNIKNAYRWLMQADSFESFGKEFDFILPKFSEGAQHFIYKEIVVKALEELKRQGIEPYNPAARTPVIDPQKRLPVDSEGTPMMITDEKYQTIPTKDMSLDLTVASVGEPGMIFKDGDYVRTIFPAKVALYSVSETETIADAKNIKEGAGSTQPEFEPYQNGDLLKIKYPDGSYIIFPVEKGVGEWHIPIPDSDGNVKDVKGSFLSCEGIKKDITADDTVDDTVTVEFYRDDENEVDKILYKMGELAKLLKELYPDKIKKEDDGGSDKQSNN